MDVQIPPPPPFPTETTTLQSTVPAPALSSQSSEPVTTTETVAVERAGTQDRIWLHPWTVTEMREQASQWSLAGDAGLLLYLEEFSNRLIQRTNSIQQHLNQTIDAVKSTHTRVQNCLNEFTSLANTQFIENRVYDDDETVIRTATKKDEQSTDKTNTTNNDAQEKVLQRYTEAIQYGLAVLDTHFERIEAKFDNIQNGTSSFVDDDDEDIGMSIEPILEPKDPYILRPLPCLIGTPEFMQDDYIGLGDLLTSYDEETYVAVQVEKVQSDSALSSSSEDEEDDFQAQISSAPIVAAGTSRPDVTKRTSAMLTENEDEDDLFGMNTGPKFDDFSPNKPTIKSDLFKELTVSAVANKENFSQDLDNEENDLFSISIKKRPDMIENDNDNFDNQSSIKDELEENAEQKHTRGVSMLGSTQKGMSELEKAVLRRRKAMGDPEVSFDDEEDDVNNSASSSNEIVPSPASKSTAKPSSSIISDPTSQTIITAKKIGRSSIFDEHTQANDDDNDDELFMDAPKSKQSPSVVPSSSTTVDKKSSLIILPKKRKDLFDNDTDEDDDPFQIQPKKTSPSLSIKRIDSNSKVQSTVTNKPNLIAQKDESSEDELFGTKNSLPKPVPTVSQFNLIEKTKSPSSDDDLFSTPTLAKPQPFSTIIKESDNGRSLFTRKSPVQESQPAVAPSFTSASIPAVKKSIPPMDEDSDDEIFGISKTKPKAPIIQAQKTALPGKPDDANHLFPKLTPESKLSRTETQKVTPPTNLNNDNDNDDELFSTPKAKSKAPSVEVGKAVPSTKNDDEDGLFPKTVNQPKVAVTDMQKTTTPIQLDDNDDDKLFGSKSTTQNKGPLTGLPKVLSVESDEDNLFSSKPAQAKTPAAAISPAFISATPVKSEVYEDPLLGIRKFAETAPQPPSVKPIETSSTSPVSLTKVSTSDSDDEEFVSKRKLNQAALKDDEKPNVKALSSLLNINLNAHRPGTHLKIHSVKEEPPAISPDDVQHVDDSANVSKKLSDIHSDSEDNLFSSKKKQIIIVPAIEEKDKNNSENGNSKVKIKDLSSRINIKPSMHMPSNHSTSIPNKENEPDAITPTISTDIIEKELTTDKTILNILKDRTKVSVRTRAPPTRRIRSVRASSTISTNENNDLFAPLNSNVAVASSSSVPITASLNFPPSATPSLASVTGLQAAIFAQQTNSSEKSSPFDFDDSDIDELLFGFSKKNKSSAIPKPTKIPSATLKATTKPSVLSLDDDDDDDSDVLSKRPITKSMNPIDHDDIFADITIKVPKSNKAKKDWSIMDKTVADDGDDIFNDASLKSSTTTSNSKSTNVKSKSIKNLDDIFDDPLNVSSKR